MRKITKLILHCSDSDFGDAALIDTWHRNRGFAGCGYHFVITNGRERSGGCYHPNLDGVVQEGRSLDKAGAHCRGFNSDSIGICLIGRQYFTARQLMQALPNLLLNLMVQFTLTPADLHGHRIFNPAKTCPNIDMGLLRQQMIRLRYP